MESKITLADESTAARKRRWVVSADRNASGRKLDTHVEVDLPLGVVFPTTAAGIRQIFTSPAQRKSARASVGVFYVFLLQCLVHGVAHDFVFVAHEKARARAAAAPISRLRGASFQHR